eukprot:TRINITY_DN7200_c0_g1_i1.p1 TRINITY_DN7200_c0_g1~~TRINITY_DN7200_c0_g1_i1.p1  ORF type:complete len:428 (+),score=83.87 TRINITY_DN7200_c0_g1_i1:110-1285(+)
MEPNLNLDLMGREATMEDYADLPVDDFGANILRGFGWDPKKGLGRREKAAPTKVVEFVGRQGRLGLGATPMEMPEPDGRRRKPGDPPRSAAAQNMVAVGPEGQVRHVRDIDAPLVPRPVQGVAPGGLVRIDGGEHAGIFARVLQVAGLKGSELCILALANGENLTAKKTQVSAITRDDLPPNHPLLEIVASAAAAAASAAAAAARVQQETAMNKGFVEDTGKDKKADKDRDRRNDNSRGLQDERDRDRDRDRDKGKDRARPLEDEGPAVAAWIHPRIRVRVISKSGDGQNYLKKGVVVDVIDRTRCIVQLDDQRKLLDGISQRDLETVVPRVGTPVLVVLGRLRGRKGVLLEKNLEKERAVVQLTGDDHDIVTVHLDQLSEWCAPLDDDQE